MVWPYSTQTILLFVSLLSLVSSLLSKTTTTLKRKYNEDNISFQNKYTYKGKKNPIKVWKQILNARIKISSKTKYSAEQKDNWFTCSPWIIKYNQINGNLFSLIDRGRRQTSQILWHVIQVHATLIRIKENRCRSSLVVIALSQENMCKISLGSQISISDNSHNMLEWKLKKI